MHVVHAQEAAMRHVAGKVPHSAAGNVVFESIAIRLADERDLAAVRRKYRPLAEMRDQPGVRWEAGQRIAGLEAYRERASDRLARHGYFTARRREAGNDNCSRDTLSDHPSHSTSRGS